MALEGTLQDFALVDILQLIGMQRKTGVLTLTRGDESINVVLQDGMVVWAGPAEEVFEANLGRILVRRGLATRERWEEARQIRSRSGTRLIPFLQAGQWISPKDLERMVQRLALETLYRALRWRDGRYSFNPQGQVDPNRGKIPPVGTETILLEAVRQMDEWPLIEQRLPSLDLVVRRSGRPAYRDQAPPEALTVLQMVDGQRTAREIAELCDIGEFDAYKGIADLVSSGAVQVESRAGAAEELAPIRVRRPMPSWLLPAAVGAVALVALVMQLAFSHDPLRLFPSRPATAQAEIQAHSLEIARHELPRALDQYLLLRRRYPQRLSDLQVERLSTAAPRDPWGNPWVYEGSASTYRLMSAGPDGRVGTADDIVLSPSGRPE
jgi:hypothetical protein